MVLVRVFEDEKAIVTRINYTISQNWQFWNFFKIYPKPDLDAWERGSENEDQWNVDEMAVQ